jgi:hypothetical protein
MRHYLSPNPGMFYRVGPSPPSASVSPVCVTKSFIRCKPLQYHGLTMCEKHTRLSQFASPLPLGVIRLTAVTWVRPELAFMARTTAVRDRQRPPAWCSFWAIEATAYIPNPCTPIEIAIH